MYHNQDAVGGLSVTKNRRVKALACILVPSCNVNVIVGAIMNYIVFVYRLDHPALDLDSLLFILGQEHNCMSQS